MSLVTPRPDEGLGTGSRELAAYGTTVVVPTAGGLEWPHRAAVTRPPLATG